MIYNGINKPLLGIKLNRTHRLSKDLVGCWLFNEGGGNTVYDASGYGNHGTLGGMAFPATATSGWNPGRKGVGLRFDGVGDYIHCGNDSSLDITDAITIEAWVKFNGDGNYYLADKRVASSPGTIVMYFLANGTFNVLINDGGAVKAPISSFSATDGWFHVAITAKNNSADNHIYKNGVDISTDQAARTFQTNTGNLTIGIGHALGTYPFNGSIDGVRIYNRALSASEITQLYRTPFCMFEIDDSWVLQAGKPKPPTGANIVAAKLLL